jgi:hypothetical protein
MTTRTKALPLFFLVAALFGACTTLPPQPASSLPYFLDSKPQQVRRDVINRYACLTGSPLICQCTSRFSGNCDCQCPQ